MAGSRTLKLSILADVDDLRKKLGQGSDTVEGFGSKLANVAKVATVAFAAVGAAAIKFGVEFAKNAAADEAAQRKLAKTLENTTKATEGQIAAIEQYISKTSLAKGVTDDELRPAFERLTRSSKDSEESQKLLNLALDISSATGKPLELIANSLGKAYDGNTNALGRLGLGIDQSILKTKDFNKVYENLRTSFKGFAEQEANTFEGKLRRLQIAFDEGKETIGGFILDAITPIITLLVNKLIPAISKLSTDIGKTLQPVFEDLTNFFTEYLIPLFKQWWAFISDIVIPGIKATLLPILEGLISAWTKVAKSIKDNETNLRPLYDVLKIVAEFVATTLAPAIGKTLGGAFNVLGTILSGIITAFSKLVGFIESAISGIQRLATLIKNNPITNMFSGATVPSPSMPSNPGGNGNFYQVNVNGAIDPVGTARTIQNLLNSEATLSGNFIDGVGTSRFAAAV